MTERRYKVPEGMLDAAYGEYPWPADWTVEQCVKKGVEASLRWLSENPIVPTDEQILEMEKLHQSDCSLWNRFGSSNNHAYYCYEWQRRMFLAPPEPEVLEEIKDLLDSTDDPIFNGWKKKILEAYRRGQRSKDGQR